MRYKYVVFDLDGTIVDSQLGSCKGFQGALKAYGVEESLENIKSLLGPPLSRTIITKYGFSEEDGAAAMKLHFDYLKTKGIFDATAYEDMAKMLQTLKDNGIKIAIATNKPEGISIKQLEHLKLKDYFDFIIGNNEAQNRGTKAEFIKAACEAIGVTNKEEAVMVGDRFNDLEGGVENGLDTIGVTYGYGSEEEIVGCKPTFIAKSPMDIADIVLDK